MGFSARAKKEYAAKKREEQIAKLEAATKELMSSEGWKRWLNTRAKFRQYSFNNQIMIAMQRPDATQVAGFKKWQELNRQVRKGEKAIGIFAPSIKKYTETDENGDEETRRVMRFRIVSVFDVSQTDGEPLPELSVHEVEGDDLESHIAPLVEYAIANDLASEVDFRDLSERPQGGWFNPQTKEIVVDSSKSKNAQPHGSG